MSTARAFTLVVSWDPRDSPVGRQHPLSGVGQGDAPWPQADGPELAEAPTRQPLAWALLLCNEIWNVYLFTKHMVDVQSLFCVKKWS